MGLISVGQPTGEAPDTQMVISTAITIFDQKGLEIGYIESLNYSTNRPAELKYHLNAADAGRPIANIGGIEKGTLSATGFALYDATSILRGGLINRLVGASGAAFVSLANQTIPFTIRQTEQHPANPALLRKTRYLGCMLTRLSRPVSIGTMTIMESVDFNYMYQM
jgi:hypothetical protein